MENKVGRGRKEILSAASKRKIVMAIKVDPKVSALKLASEMSQSIGRKVCLQTVRIVLIKANYNGRTARKKSLISMANQVKLLQFAKMHTLKTENFWKRVIFSDESKFNVFGSDGRRTVWKKPNTALNPKNSDCKTWRRVSYGLGMYGCEWCW